MTPLRWPGRRALVAAWVVGGAVVLALAGLPDVRRTQEARVLETAREMLAGGAASPRVWVVPQLNGKPRLQKPPLAYWATAASFAAFGVGTWSGRVPAILAAWLTVGLTFDIARRLFDRRAAACAAAVLTSSYMFVRFGTVAETDVWVALLTTAAVAALLRCFEIDAGAAVDASHSPAVARNARRRFIAWSHSAAAATGLIGLVKGPPLVYPLLFLVFACVARHQWRVLGRWVVCGAPLTVALLAVPWFAYVATIPEAADVLAREARVMTAGGGHRGGPHVVAELVLTAAAPWSGMVPLALAAAIPAAVRRRDAGVTTALAWLAAVLIPLLVIGQKQDHYMPPVLAPVAVLTGWFLVRSIDRIAGAVDADRWPEWAAPAVLAATLVAAAAMVVALPVAGHHVRGHVSAADIVVAAAAALVVIVAVARWRRRGYPAACLAVLAGAPPLVVATLLVWGPTLEPVTNRDVAAALRRELGVGPDVDLGARCAFYDEAESVVLCWAMRSVIPTVRTPRRLSAATARAAPPVLIATPRHESPAAATDGRSLPVPPPGYVERRRYQLERRPVVLYVPAATSPAEPSTSP
jgi:4-amino-4-deoxy-L-arabinose transferase-like glycosyltransferase